MRDDYIHCTLDFGNLCCVFPHSTQFKYVSAQCPNSGTRGSAIRASVITAEGYDVMTTYEGLRRIGTRYVGSADLYHPGHWHSSYIDEFVYGPFVSCVSVES